MPQASDHELNLSVSLATCDVLFMPSFVSVLSVNVYVHM